MNGKKTSKILRKLIPILLSLIIVIGSTLFYGNFTLDTEVVTISSNKITSAFDGFRIAHISDFHNRDNNRFRENIISAVKENNPDIIVITGDMIDFNRTDISIAVSFADELCNIAPVYYVTGNHELDVKTNSPELYEEYLSSVKSCGVNILSNKSIEINRNKEKINIYGIEELYTYTYDYTRFPVVAEELLNDFTINSDEFNILLAHHPEQLKIYSFFSFDLVFSGHAHGGQFRLFGKGLLAPNQGFFPEYTGGVYNEGDTKLVLSRGLGNSSFPVRIFNRAHLIITELHTS